MTDLYLGCGGGSSHEKKLQASGLPYNLQPQNRLPSNLPIVTEMEQSLSSLAFKGSITEAIAEAKQQKKLFVVYTSGENPESKLLETSTWSDLIVAESLTKYCILLHLLEGSSDATNFSAIYPHNSVPCITAIGYNGVRLWEKEGFVTADVLVSNLEKAWLSLHVQETTAAFLTAALASKKPLATGTSETAASEHGTNMPSSSTDNQVQSLHAEQLSSSVETDDSNSCQDASKEIDSELGDKASHIPSTHAAVSASGKLDDNASTTVTENISLNPLEVHLNNSEVDHPILDKNVDSCDHHLEISKDVSREISREANEAAQVDTENTEEVEKADASDSSAVQSNDVFLNIRLPDGSSLQVKLSMMDTLRVVKNHINENQTSSFGPYNLAIPYPRKVFNEQDLDSTLSELGLIKRQALVVVPCKGTNLQYKGGSSSSYQTNSSNDPGSSNGSNQRYWALLKTALSYVNPLSYLGGGASSSSSAQDSQSGTWQYSPNSSLGNNPRGDGRPSTDQNPSTSGRSRPHTSSQFGGNIHTLKHEDDSRFNDRNAFWNGNSTQFGGDNDGK
ncbi:Plant UBX domain-containing protein 11 [Abeliophyllum distichum]|uniref:Plant UBX domain-containing protein 11 n=1 Tax=Abeliophyllum distichum TaxID=126358 RepID=A0ABD1Q1Z0_9LAMI